MQVGILSWEDPRIRPPKPWGFVLAVCLCCVLEQVVWPLWTAGSSSSIGTCSACLFYPAGLQKGSSEMISMKVLHEM